jgi:hypothetical protein
MKHKNLKSYKINGHLGASKTIFPTYKQGGEVTFNMGFEIGVYRLVDLKLQINIVVFDIVKQGYICEKFLIKTENRVFCYKLILKFKKIGVQNENTRSNS